ncbi:protein phosphatase 1 regulatory subunit 3G [Lampris incognitus]|uniref:protein phosphatase 1 regulatory subunit 3G n=1 Tax=Lampris incognitus TaxID=2546036 RepID=UPI0024B4B746|nr:protein phosphatase 1 regulatory subunit 3G [Lampris incognitus]
MSDSRELHAENRAEEGDEEEEDEEEVDDLVDSRQLERFMRDRRRARSLPAYPEQEALLQELSAGTGRKRVKFADSLGLSLASVKHFSTLDEPNIPSGVLPGLRSFPQRDTLDDLCTGFKSGLALERLVPTFLDPGGQQDFRQRVETQRVSLERAFVSQFDVRGQIRVDSGGAEKEVGVRYTFDDWLSHADAQALPVPADKAQPGWFGERFSFTMRAPPGSGAASVHFAVYARSDGAEFWDNNRGHNYTLRRRRRRASDATAHVSAAYCAD